MPPLDALPRIADDVDRLRKEIQRLTDENAGLARQIRAMSPVVSTAMDVVVAVYPPTGEPSSVGVKLELDRLKAVVGKYRRSSCST